MACLYDVGAPDADSLVGVECLSSVLKSDDTFSAATSMSVRPYNPAQLNLLQKEHSTVDVLPLLDPETRHFLENPESCILKTDPDDVASGLKTPFYSDPALSDKATCLDLVRRLGSKGLISYQLTRRARVGLFFVWKKVGANSHDP